MNWKKTVFAGLALGMTLGDKIQAEESKAWDGSPSLDPLVVSVTRIDTPLRQVAGSVQVITREEIEARQAKTLGDALAGAAGLDVRRSGGPGKATDVYTRGTGNNHTLILMDGVEMNDPMVADRSYDFSHVMLDNVERIEILEGPQSTLYGSDAIGGVINIVTRKGTGKPHASLGLEGGAFGSFLQTLNLSGSHGWSNVFLAAAHSKTNGISAADSDLGNLEKDSDENLNLSARLGLEPGKRWSGNVMVKHINSETGLDNGAGRGMDDPNHVARSRQTFLHTDLNLKLFDGAWNHTAGFSYSDHDNRINNDPDPVNSDFAKSEYRGKTLAFDWQSQIKIKNVDNLLIGVERQQDRGDSESFTQNSFGTFNSVFDDKYVNVNSYFAQNQIRLSDSITFSLGGRLDDHQSFGTQPTYRAAGAYVLKETSTKFNASYGTGFKAPTLFQLYSAFGDTTLKPEKSLGWDAGVEQSFLENRTKLGATYFANELKNLIQFDSVSFKYNNLADARTEGVEVFAGAKPVDRVFVRLKYTYMETLDKTTQQPLVRRARNKLGADLNVSPAAALNVNLHVDHVGRRDDVDFSTLVPSRVELKGYTLVNLALSYKLMKYLELTGRIDNLFNEQYEDILGFGAPGIGGAAGARVTF